jgi:hypothetical protein
MNWIDLKNNIYYCDGSLRDIYILDINKSDWKKWVDYVNNNYKVIWFNGLLSKDENQINFSVIDDYWEGKHDLCSTAKICINDFQINTHFFDDSEIENDIDPREFNSIDDHNKLIKYLIDLSTLLDKEIILTPENEQETVLLRIFKHLD